MKLYVNNNEDRDKAEEYLFKTVKVDDLYAKLIAIYDNTFETTIGLTNTIETDVKGTCTYTAAYVEFIPCMFHYKAWVFPDGSTGSMLIDFNNKQEPYVQASTMQNWSHVEEADIDEEE